jgi:FAD/FMN-containing dehydrogenase
LCTRLSSNIVATTSVGLALDGRGSWLEAILARSQSLCGRVVTADDADYDAVRAACVWNGDIDRRPWVIAQANSSVDVAAAVGFAREVGRDVAVRGGGHNFAGASIADDAVMIDLGTLCDVRSTQWPNELYAEPAAAGPSSTWLSASSG